MKKLLILTAFATSLAKLTAAEAAFQLSLTPDIALHSKTTTIKGVSLGIWGENPQESFNLGLVNGSTGESKGFAWAFIVNYTESYSGVQWALLNVSREEFTGWQAAVLNYSEGGFKGLQTGFVNIAQDCQGLQWGCLNYAENLHGVQIGFLNIAMNNPWFSEFPDKLATGFPIVNWSF